MVDDIAAGYCLSRELCLPEITADEFEQGLVEEVIDFPRPYREVIVDADGDTASNECVGKIAADKSSASSDQRLPCQRLVSPRWVPIDSASFYTFCAGSLLPSHVEDGQGRPVHVGGHG